MRRSNDPGLTGGLALDRPGGRVGVGSLGIVLIATGVLASYLACLHGAQIDEKSLVAFVAWSAAAVLIAVLADWFFRYVFILIVLLVAAMWWTERPLFETAAAQAKSLRVDICGRIDGEGSIGSVKEWVC